MANRTIVLVFACVIALSGQKAFAVAAMSPAGKTAYFYEPFYYISASRIVLSSMPSWMASYGYTTVIYRDASGPNGNFGSCTKQNFVRMGNDPDAGFIAWVSHGVQWGGGNTWSVTAIATNSQANARKWRRPNTQPSGFSYQYPNTSSPREWSGSFIQNYVSAFTIPPGTINDNPPGGNSVHTVQVMPTFFIPKSHGGSGILGWQATADDRARTIVWAVSCFSGGGPANYPLKHLKKRLSLGYNAICSNWAGAADKNQVWKRMLGRRDAGKKRKAVDAFAFKQAIAVASGKQNTTFCPAIEGLAAGSPSIYPLDGSTGNGAASSGYEGYVTFDTNVKLCTTSSMLDDEAVSGSLVVKISTKQKKLLKDGGLIGYREFGKTEKYFSRVAFCWTGGSSGYTWKMICEPDYIHGRFRATCGSGGDDLKLDGDSSGSNGNGQKYEWTFSE